MLTNSLLWSLEKNGITSYVYGSVHIQDSKAFQFTPYLVPYIQQVDVFAAELDFDDIQAQMRLQDNEEEQVTWSYRRQLKPKANHKLTALLKRAFGLDLGKVDHLSPIMLVQQLTVMSLGKDVPYNLDLYLWNMAKEYSCKCIGLETWEEQSEIYQEMERQAEMKELYRLTRNVSAFKKSIKSVIDLYVEQDINSLYKKTRKTLGPYRKIMINHRNQILVDRFEEIASNEAVFTTVGAAHLAGEFGVLRGLKHRGFKVVPVELS